MSGEDEAPVFSEEQREWIERLLYNQLSERPLGDASTRHPVAATGSTPTGMTIANPMTPPGSVGKPQDGGIWYLVDLQARGWTGQGALGRLDLHDNRFTGLV